MQAIMSLLTYFYPSATRTQREAAKRHAIEGGLIERIPFDPVTSFADFSSVRLEGPIRLPEELWDKPARVHFAYLDNLIGGHRPGTTWHHHQDSGLMELIPLGIHKAYNHRGGCTTWATNCYPRD